jgi:hypothetical protein
MCHLRTGHPFVKAAKRVKPARLAVWVAPSVEAQPDDLPNVRLKHPIDEVLALVGAEVDRVVTAADVDALELQLMLAMGLIYMSPLETK